MRFALCKFLILALVLVTVTGAMAAELTLDDCITLALKNRASIISARNAEQLAAVSQRAALGAFLPNVAASYRYTHNEITNIKPDENVPTAYDTTISTVVVGGDTAKVVRTRVTDYTTIPSPDIKSTSKIWDISGGISFTLPDAWFSYAAARLDHESARLDVIASEQDLILAVKQAFYLYLATVQDVSVQEEAVKRSDEQLKLIQSKFELGSAAKSDVLKQKVQYGNDKLALLQAQNAVITANASLAYTIGLDPMQDHQFSTQYSVRQFEGTLAEAVQFGLTHKPSLLSTEKSIGAANQSLMSAKWGYLPKASPFVSYGYERITGPNQSYNPLLATSTEGTESRNTLTYGLSFNWNIFDGFAREQRVKAAKVAKNNLQASLADSRNLVASQIKSAYLNIDQLKQRQQVARDNVDAASEDLKITQEKYNLGAATILDLLDAQVSMKQAQVAQISADFDLNVAISNLENAMGKM